MKMWLLFFFQIFFFILQTKAFSSNYVPVVLMHGINSNCSKLDHAKSLLEKYLPGIYVLSVEIGNGKVDSIFWNMNEQLNEFNKIVTSDTNLTRGFNLMGVSQGGILSRGYLERLNNPPVKTFISWVSPQGGQFGLPHYGEYLWIDELIDCCVYDSVIQELIAPTNYWKDPYALDEYLQCATFLPDLDNARETKNSTYKQNILKLESFVMSYSTVDTTLVPKETGYFGFYAPNQSKVVIPLEESDLWKEDWIGLRTLSEQGKLFRFTTDCSHGDYSSSCFDKYFLANVLPHFNKTF